MLHTYWIFAARQGVDPFPQVCLCGAYQEQKAEE